MSLRYCRFCRRNKEETNFSVVRLQLNTMCMSCDYKSNEGAPAEVKRVRRKLKDMTKKEYGKMYRAENAEKNRAVQREYYQRNKKKLKDRKSVV